MYYTTLRKDMKPSIILYLPKKRRQGMKLSAILHLPRMDTLLRKSSYIFLFRMVLPWGQNRWYWSYFQYLCDFSSMYGFIEKEMQAHCRMWQSVKCECVLCELAAHAEVLVYVNEYFVSILCQYYVSILCVNQCVKTISACYVLCEVWGFLLDHFSEIVYMQPLLGCSHSHLPLCMLLLKLFTSP